MSLCGRNGDTSYQQFGYSFTVSTKESECIEKFLTCIGTSPTETDNEIRAFKFLAARKFNLKEAVELFYSHEAFLKSEGITVIDPFEESVRRELLSGKFTVLNDSDPSGARVAQFFLRLHRPTRSSHKVFLQSVMFQLSAILRKETAVRNGIILIYDMTNSKYSNFDADLSKKLFNMLKSCYPIRLRRIIVLKAPLWFRAPFHLLSVFVKEDLRDRVHVLRPSPGSRLASLSNPDPVVAQKEHFTWLLTALSETVAVPNGLLSSPDFGVRQPSAAISAFFDISNSGAVGSSNSTIDRSGCSSSSASEAGEEISTSADVSTTPPGPLTEDEGLMAVIGCCSPNWDPFALSSSQSSDAESTGLPVNPSPTFSGVNTGADEVSAPRNVMSMSCSPVLNLTPKNLDATGEFACLSRGTEAVQEPLRDPAGTPTPPAIPKFGSPFNGACVDTDPAATPTSETFPIPSLVSGASYTGTKQFYSHTGGLVGTQGVMRCAVRQAPLASQDDFVVLSKEGSKNTCNSNTIRKEKRSKQANISPSTTTHSVIHPSELIPLWALNRPSGPSIHTGSHSVAGTSVELNNDPQPDKFYCFSETSPAVHSSPTCHRLRSRVIQSPSTQANAPLNKDDADTDDEDDENEDDDQVMEDADDYFYEDDGEEEVVSLDLDSLWMTPDQLVSHVVEQGASGLMEEYSEVCSIKTNDPCTAFRRPCNSSKNRYVDVTCLEHSRVKLCSHQNTTSRPIATTVASGGKVARTEKQVPIYIHANWVDSYRQRNAFICTQGPLQETAGDFWFMVWTYNVPAIVMITRCYESQRCKCFQYWPTVEGQSLRFTTISPCRSTVVTTGLGSSCGNGELGSETMASNKKKTSREPARRSASEVSSSSKFVFEVTHVSSQAGDDCIRTKLQLKDVKSGLSRTVDHYAFRSWPDHGVPSDSTALLELLTTVQTEYAAAIKRELNYTTAYDIPIPPPPIVVHCSAGIGRTGTFIALDVSTKQLMELGVVNVPLTVARIRSQRSGCVQVSAQYLFVYRALIDFAVARGLVTEAAAEAAIPQLMPSTRPPVASLMSSSPSFSLPMDASLLSVLAASIGTGLSSTVLLRNLRNRMANANETADLQAATEEVESDDDGSELVEFPPEEEDAEAVRSNADRVSAVVKTVKTPLGSEQLSDENMAAVALDPEGPASTWRS